MKRYCFNILSCFPVKSFAGKEYAVTSGATWFPSLGKFPERQAQ
jgi:hypothetical protein